MRSLKRLKSSTTDTISKLTPIKIENPTQQQESGTQAVLEKLEKSPLELLKELPKERRDAIEALARTVAQHINKFLQDKEFCETHSYRLPDRETAETRAMCYVLDTEHITFELCGDVSQSYRDDLGLLEANLESDSVLTKGLLLSKISPSEVAKGLREETERRMTTCEIQQE